VSATTDGGQAVASGTGPLGAVVGRCRNPNPHPPRPRPSSPTRSLTSKPHPHLHSQSRTAQFPPQPRCSRSSPATASKPPATHAPAAGSTSAPTNTPTPITAGHCATRPGETVRDHTAAPQEHSSAPWSTRPASAEPTTNSSTSACGPFPCRRRPTRHRQQPPKPRPGQKVCRAGITTGTVCGQVTRSLGDHQYLTVGIDPTIGGDSGGPVWTTDTGDGTVHIIGIWLGGRTTIAGETSADSPRSTTPSPPAEHHRSTPRERCSNLLPHSRFRAAAR
jgi:hypothetical protein